MASVEDVSTWTPELCEEHTSACKAHLESVWETVPLLNYSYGTFQEGQVVRFRGMLQDCLGLSIHVEKHEVVNELTGEVSVRTGKYRHSFNTEAGDKITESNKYIDCYSFLCVTVPGLNPWAKKSFLHSSNLLDEDRGARKRSFDEMMEEMNVEESIVQHGMEVEGANAELQPVFNSVKETECCIVKFFEQEGNDLPLNTVIDAIGFYAPPLQDADEEEMPHQLKPLLMVVNFRKLSHTCPLLPMVNFESEVDRITSTSAAALQNLRTLFLPLLQGDAVAFEFLLMNLVSHVFIRSLGRGVVKGQLSVNFIAIPTGMEYGEKMCAILKQVVPKTSYLRFSRECLNAGSLVPIKDHQLDQLVQKPLQLSMGTVIVVDEAALDEGKLTADGARNILHLTNMLSKQSLYYNFEHSEIEFDTDYPTIIFSDQKSMLKADVVVALKPVQYVKPDELKAAFEAANQFLKNDSIANSMRAFVAAARESYSGLGDESMEQFLTEDFVMMRDNNPSFGADDFDRLLLLSRWYALSHGKVHLDPDVWHRVKLLDQARVDNLTS